MKKIEEMSILITGGGSGIGAGAARYFSELGAKVTICGRREANVMQVSKEIGPNGSILTPKGPILATTQAFFCTISRSKETALSLISSI